LNEQAYADGTAVFWDSISQDPAVDTSTDVCLVFINAFATEGNDRVGLHGTYIFFDFFQRFPAKSDANAMKMTTPMPSSRTSLLNAQTPLSSFIMLALD
jgi:hypothetical protein